MFCLSRRQSTIAAPKSSEQGFTLLEILVVIVMVSVLGAIATPAWLKFVDWQPIRDWQSLGLSLG